MRVSKRHHFLSTDFFFFFFFFLRKEAGLCHTQLSPLVQRSQSIRGFFVVCFSQGRVGDQNAGRDETLR